MPNMNRAKETDQTKKTYLSLAERVSKNQENIKRTRRPEIILKKREVFGQNGRDGISAVYFKNNFSHNIL